MPALDFPSSPVDGQIFGNYTYDSGVAVWRATPQVASGLPAGTIVQWPGAVAPTSWLICDGSAVSRSTYASLFAAIGTQYGSGDGSTTFNVPNLKGRVAVGLDSSQTEFNTLGETGGAKTHTLTTSEMPVHSHGVTDPGHGHGITDPGHTHAALGDASDGSAVLGLDAAAASKNGSYGGLIAAAATGITINGSGTGISINNAGSGGAHNNLQPYVVLNYIIKTSAGITAGDSELATRVGAIEAVDSTQNSRLTALETAVPSVGWTAYTPSFSNITIGNGSTAFYYQKVGKVVHVRGLIIYGSTTSFNGACDFSHPAMAGTYNILHPMGYAEFYGSGLRHGRIVRINDTYSRFVCDVVSGTTVSNAELSNTYPFTWASGYWAMLSMSYETG